MARPSPRKARRRPTPRAAPGPSPRLRTIGDELDWGSGRLRRARVARPQMWCLATWAVLARSTPGAVWLTRHDLPASPDFVGRFRAAIGQQARGAPFQAAVGRAAFRRLELEWDPRVLIPRAETEGLVDHVLSWAAERFPGGPCGTVADVGTGAGPIALSLALEGRFERVVATDVSADALVVARRNAARVRPPTPIEFREGWFLEPLAGEKFQVVVSNPPYLTSDECDRLAPGVRDYEPRLALDGGPDGLDAFRVILAGAGALLEPGAFLALEIDSRRPEAICRLARAAGWSDAKISRDAFGRGRYLLATRGNV